jgi:Transposase DDE domain group 1
MPTKRSAEQFDFGRAEGQAVEAAFDDGLVTSNAGAVLLDATDWAIDLVGRFADCFGDYRRQDLIEHGIGIRVGQRVLTIALGYEDLNDHDELRHDPLMAVLSGKLAARREYCAPVAGKWIFNRLELSREEFSRYHKIACDAAAIEALPVTPFLAAHKRPPEQIILDLDATDDPLHGQEGRFFHGYYDCYCYLPPYVFCGRHLLAAMLHRTSTPARAASRRSSGSCGKSAPAGRSCASCCEPTVALRARR